MKPASPLLTDLFILLLPVSPPNTSPPRSISGHMKNAISANELCKISTDIPLSTWFLAQKKEPLLAPSCAQNCAQNLAQIGVFQLLYGLEKLSLFGMFRF